MSSFQTCTPHFVHFTQSINGIERLIITPFCPISVPLTKMRHEILAVDFVPMLADSSPTRFVGVLRKLVAVRTASKAQFVVRFGHFSPKVLAGSAGGTPPSLLETPEEVRTGVQTLQLRIVADLLLLCKGKITELFC